MSKQKNNELNTDPLSLLAVEAQKGDTEAREALFKETQKICLPYAIGHSNAIRGNGWMTSVDDFLNIGLTRLLINLPKYDPKRSAWSTFAYRVFRFACIDARRLPENNPACNHVNRQNSRSVEARSLDKAVNMPDGSVCQGSDLQGQCDPIPEFETDDAFNKAIEGLSKDQRICLRLMYLFSFNMKETGRAIGVSESRVSQLVKKAKQQVRDAHR